MVLESNHIQQCFEADFFEIVPRVFAGTNVMHYQLLRRRPAAFGVTIRSTRDPYRFIALPILRIHERETELERAPATVGLSLAVTAVRDFGLFFSSSVLCRFRLLGVHALNA